MIMRVCVLLSTYNGEKFLNEQIDSLLIQENVDVHILVRDDGSSDGTLRILEDYEKQGSVSLIRGGNIGWKKSFMQLLYNSPDSDYYAFCDQDDIWLPEKLYMAVESLESMPKDTPNLYGSNLRYYRDGVDMGMAKMRIPSTSYRAALCKNLTAGCTMVFNKALRDLVCNNPTQIDFPHDYWIFLVSALFGKVYYDSNAYVLYRQHSANQIGATLTRTDIWKTRIENFKGLCRSQGRQSAAAELLRLYHDRLTEEQSSYIKKVALYNESLKNRLLLFFDKEYSMGSWDSNIGLRIRILLGSI